MEPLFVNYLKLKLLKNKGYGTSKHMEGIKNYGISKWHRTTYGCCKEAPINDDVRQLDVAHKALQEIWPKQTNLVNFEGFGELLSLRFVKQDKWQTTMIKVP